MRRFSGVGLGLLALAVSAGAGEPPAQLALPITTVVIDSDRGPLTFKVEVAADSASQERGLMYRTRMAPDAGMLFDFHASQNETFWMKNTVLPLDLLFVRADGTISSIAPNATPYSETPIPSSEPVRAVIEINGGRAAAVGIEPGQVVHNTLFRNARPGQK